MPVKSKDNVGPCEVSLDIEVESGKVAEAVDRAYREFSKYIAVPGFRKGKAPMAFVRQRVPQDQLRERASELLIGPAYEQALRESEVQPYAQPRVQVVKFDTTAPDYVLEFKAVVPLAPNVTLGQYTGLEVERDVREVTDADVEERINSLRERAAEYPLIEGRPAELGDVIVGDLSVTPADPDDDTVEDETTEDEQSGEESAFQPTAIQLGDAGNIPGVDDALLGADRGDEKMFELVYPADYPNAEAAGHRAQFVLRVKELHSKIVPELDAEFAKKFGGVDSMDEMRAKMRADMERASAETAEAGVESKLVDAVVANSTIEYPTVLIDVEMEEDVRAFREDLERRQMSVEDYVAQSGIGQDALLADFRARADMRLRRGLVLGEIAKAENQQLTDADVNREIQSRADAQRTSAEAMRAYIDSSKGIDAIRNAAYTKKILGFIASSAVITDHVVTADEAQDEEIDPIAGGDEESVSPAALSSTAPDADIADIGTGPDAVEVSDTVIETGDEGVKPKRARKKAADVIVEEDAGANG